MPRGGHPYSGPPPDPDALRRNRAVDVSGWTVLPAEGRSGRSPRWPLTEAAEREVTLWRELWRRPQAVMWERLDQRYEVALFVRNLARAERSEASIELQKVIRQYLDSLGLSVQGMLRNRWRLAPPAEPAAVRDARRGLPRASSRDRMTVLGESGWDRLTLIPGDSED